MIQVTNSDYFGVSIDKNYPIHDSLIELSPISGVSKANRPHIFEQFPTETDNVHKAG